MVMRWRLSILIVTAALALAAPVVANTEDDLQAAANAEMAGDHDRAIALSTALLDSHGLDDSQTGRAYLVRGYAHLAMGDAVLALPDLDEVVRRDGDPDILLVRASAHRALKQYDAAIADLSTAAGKAPQNANVYCARAEAHYAKGDTADAIADYSKCIGLDPGNADAYLNRGENYQNAGQFDKAVADYNAAIKLDPKMAMAYNDRGTISERGGRNDDAIADFNKALQIDPRGADYLENLGWIYYMRGDFDAALAKFDASLQTRPDNAQAYSDRGDVRFAQGDFARAAQDYAAAIAHDPDDMLSRLSLYLAKARLGTPDRSVLSGNKKLDAGAWPDVMALYFLGKADMAAVDSVAAKQDVEFGAARTCQRDFLLGEDALSRGDKAKAKDYFGKVMAACTPQTAPNYPAVKRELGQAAP